MGIPDLTTCTYQAMRACIVQQSGCGRIRFLDGGKGMSIHTVLKTTKMCLTEEESQ